MIKLTFSKKSLLAMPTLFKNSEYELKISTPTLQVSIDRAGIVTVRQLIKPQSYERHLKAYWAITRQYEAK